jgi:hypothetical protein
MELLEQGKLGGKEGYWRNGIYVIEWFIPRMSGLANWLRQVILLTCFRNLIFVKFQGLEEIQLNT